MIVSCVSLGFGLAFYLAQPAALGPPADVIVTGERVKRTTSSTASSVFAVTADDIANLPVPDRVEQILGAIPNVQLGSQSSAPTIRGQDTGGALRDLGAFLGGTRPRTTLVVDGRAVGFNEFVFGSQSLWEVSRVEVFRTPQSTTQGRNSIAGAIFVHTADPSPRFEASGRAIVGGASTRQLSAMLNAPVSDDVSIRLSGDWRNGRASSELSDPSRPQLDLSRDRTRLLRGKLEATPPLLGSGRLLLTATHARSAMPQLEGLRSPFERRRDPSATYGYFRTRSDSLTLQFEMPLTPTMRLDAIVSNGWANVERGAPAGFGVADNRSRDIAGELVLTRSRVSGLAITSGISVSRQVLEQDVDLSLVLGRGVFGDRQESLGLFGEAELGLLPGLTASLGLRYQWDRQRRTGVLASVRGLEGLDYTGSSDFLLPKLTMSYAWSPEVTLGLAALRASNPGGTTISLGGPLAFHPETLWSAELFARARLDQDRLRISANLFATRFDDAQRAINRVFRPVFGRPVTFSDIVNVARARSRGLEVGLDWAVHPSLDLRAAGALLSTRLHPAPGQPFGREFQRAPAWSSTFGIAWRPLAPLTLSGQARGRAGYHSDDTNSPSLRVGTGWIFDGRIAWEHSRFRLFAYGRNLSDRFQLTNYLNQDLASAEDPRELGMGLELRF